MALGVRPTPTRFPTYSLYTPMDNPLLHSIPNVCRAWGNAVLSQIEVAFARRSVVKNVIAFLLLKSAPLFLRHSATRLNIREAA